MRSVRPSFPRADVAVGAWRHNRRVPIVAVQSACQQVDERGVPCAPPVLPGTTAEWLAYVEEQERTASPRWVVGDCAATYPVLLNAGVRLRKAHDLRLTEALLQAYAGSPAPHDAPQTERPSAQPDLFEPEPVPEDPATAVAAASRRYADQLARIAATERPRHFELLVAAESAGGLAACEMTAAGIPWDIGVHDAVLTELLGTVDPAGGRPSKLAALAERVHAGFGRPVNPDSPADLLAAFRQDGYAIDTTRATTLRQLDHPAAAALLAYKEVARIHSAHGWAWQAAWIADGRFRPTYVPGGVVSGRWATRGGGALQIPRRLRRAVVADPGHVLVVADAGQADPRVLAAMSGDPGMTEAAMADDMYTALATQAFGGDRGRAKLGLLGAMYGQTGGEAAAPLATLRRRYPVALALLEQAARAGERGAVVRSHLGRTCPPARDGEVATTPRARARGRFTRNFVVQATTAEWALALLARLRLHLADLRAPGQLAEVVFYQHDEFMVHAEEPLANAVSDAIHRAGEEATHLLFGETAVRFPLDVTVADNYLDAH
ncbi:MAG: bifunctional 3'-5' exonuclease/DNA polymerase [Streptosporangiales bacterium]|nr:bifunctional 3'-5' exonuclease/DNA polymerase [Streptosporangiales bacterium]